MALRQPPRYRVKKGKTSEDSDDFESFEYPHDAIDYLHKIHACSEGEIYDSTYPHIVITYNLETGKVTPLELNTTGDNVQVTYAENIKNKIESLATKPVEDAVSLCVKRKLLRELETLLQGTDDIDHHKSKAVNKIINAYFDGEREIANKENYKAHQRLNEAFKRISETLSPPMFQSFRHDERTHAQKAIHKILTSSKPHEVKCEKTMRKDILDKIKKEIQESKRLSSSAQTRTQAPTRKHHK